MLESTIKKHKQDDKFDPAPAKILRVQESSLAEEIGLEAGDQVLEINGKGFRDILDFQYRFSQFDDIELLVKSPEDEEPEIIAFDKGFDEEFGVEFETPLFNGVKECSNNCAFCFIDQQPHEETRESLHLKDDDFRLSYLHGSYITLTNLSRSDRNRIEELRPGPLYISVHATDLDLRNQMLGRKQSIPILDELKWLASLDIPCHAQIVLCPGINDGKNLTKTINDLYLLKDSPVQSVAIVPAGLTKYHDGGIQKFTMDDALEAISLVETWEQHCDNEDRSGFVFLSDEFYLMTATPVPDFSKYSNFPQLEDGVGTTSLFVEEIKQEMQRLPEIFDKAKTFTWINGTLAKTEIMKVAKMINMQVANLNLDPVFVESTFWGTTSVAGLLTGQDILEGMKVYFEKFKHKPELVIIPSIMLKDGEDVFLDDMGLDELSTKLKIPCIKAWGAKELVDILVEA